MLKAELVLNAGAELAEGPLWSDRDNLLYWVDINVGHLHRTDPKTGKDECFDCGEAIGTIAFRKDGGLIAACRTGIYLIDIEDGKVRKTFVVDPEPDTPNRFNDGKCDPYGRFLAGTCYTPERDEKPEITGGFYSVEEGGNVKTLLENIYISNGLCWTSDLQTLYYIDSLDYEIGAYHYDKETGNISDKKVVFSVDKDYWDGLPDGMTIDNNNHLWIALFGGSKVICVDPENGEVIETVEVPAKKVTCPVFGGENYETMYITTAWENSTPEEREKDPLGGSIFSVKPGVSGSPAFTFGK